MITLGQYTNAEILPLLGLGKPPAKFDTSDGVVTVRMSSPRLECLRLNQSCVWCKNTGTIWLLQRHKETKPRLSTNCFLKDCPWCSLKRFTPRRFLGKAHLNLYYQNRVGGLILMTRDHIHPKYRGGSDGIGNSQTMCSPCNNHKGSDCMNEFDQYGQRKEFVA